MQAGPLPKAAGTSHPAGRGDALSSALWSVLEGDLTQASARRLSQK